MSILQGRLHQILSEDENAQPSIVSSLLWEYSRLVEDG